MGLFLLVYDLFSLFIVSMFITQDISGEVKREKERNREQSPFMSDIYHKNF